MTDNHSINSVPCLNAYGSSKEKYLTCLWNIESFLSNKELKSSDNLNVFENNLRLVDGRYEAPLL